MSRFTIEDIIRQDDKGVVFRAVDAGSGDPVAVHRFFPFGQNNGGLDQDESTAFAIVAKRLAGISHPALRSILVGGTDPIDHTPYLATEWVEGVSLKTILASENVEPGLAIDILRLVLEVSTVLSHQIGEEGVWVETSVESIVVGNEASGRGFTLGISPSKWLGTDSQSKSLLSVVELGEELTGWKGKLISAQAGHGLGGWLKCMKRNPDITLHEALALLASLTGIEPPPPEQEIIRQAVRPVSKTRKSFSKATLLTVAGASLAITAGSLVYFHKTTEPPIANALYSEQKISAVIVGDPTSSKTRPASSKPSETARINALAIKMKKEAAETTSKTESQKNSLEKSRKARGGVYLPTDAPILKPLKRGTPVKFQGTLKKAVPSSTGKSIYLHFSSPYEQGQVRGVLHKSDFKGDYSLKAFNQFIGKVITLDGSAFNENSKNPVLVKITKAEQITRKK